jgi:hypothetical protein
MKNTQKKNLKIPGSEISQKLNEDVNFQNCSGESESYKD